MILFIISTFSHQQTQTYCSQHRLDDEPGTSIESSAAAGKRKRASSQSASVRHSDYNRTAGNTLALASNLKSSSIVTSAIPGSPGSRPRSVILKSAFRAPLPVRRKQWTHDPPMIKSFFIRTKAVINKDGNVEFSVSDGLEAIEIAGDWEKGQTLYEQKQPHETTGFVGMGYSKRGIYVSCPSHLHQATSIRKGRFNDASGKI